jgi:ATP-dependent DNA helicase PIF1
MELSDKQREAIELIKQKKNVFITGNAGTGKSFLMNIIKSIIPGLQITASTGIASINVGGQTLHSWSGIGLGELPADKIKLSGKCITKIRITKVLAIDEISMVSAEVLDLVNAVVKRVRKNTGPFGNIQVILFGDFFQLPPVKGDFCFNSNAWKELGLKVVLLTKIYRQVDPVFVNLLENVRKDCLSPEDKEILLSRIIKDDGNYTLLVSHNSQAELVNDRELDSLEGPISEYKAEYKGLPQKIDFLKKNCLAKDVLKLKVGARVMMLKNTFREYGIVNGSVGIVEKINEGGFPVVKFESSTCLGTGTGIPILPEIWTSQIYDPVQEKVVVEASMQQIPLLLSWAITIHKSQGMTLDRIKCNLGDVFTHGQTYVALSRVKTLEGLFIEDIDFEKINTNKYIVDYYNKISQ